MFSAWRVSVILSGINLTGPMFRSFAGDAQMSEAATKKIAMAALIAAAAIGSMAVAMGHVVADGVKQAADFETAMTKAGIATAATATNFKSLRDMVMDVSGATAQSATTIANETSMLAQSGFTMAQTMKLMSGGSGKPGPMAMYADAVQQMFGTDPVESIKLLAQAAHQAGAYQPADVHRLSEAMFELQILQPESMDKIVRQGKYWVPLAQSLGISIEQMMKIAVESGITGFNTGRGGTSVKNVLLALIGATTATSTLKSARMRAGMDLGMLDHHGSPVWTDASHNKINWAGAMAQLQKDRGLFEAGKMSFEGKTGLTGFAAVNSAFFQSTALPWVMGNQNPKALAQMKLLEEKYTAAGDEPMERAFQAFIHGTWNGIMQRIATTFKNVIIDIWTPLITDLEPFMDQFADMLLTVEKALRDHPDWARGIAYGIVALTAGLGLLAAALVGIAGFAFFSSIGASMSAILGVIGGLSIFAGAVAGAAVGVAALIQLAMFLSKPTNPPHGHPNSPAFRDFDKGFKPESVWAKMGDAIGAFTRKTGEWNDSVKRGFESLEMAISTAITNLVINLLTGKWVQDVLLHGAGALTDTPLAKYLAQAVHDFQTHYNSAYPSSGKPLPASIVPVVPQVTIGHVVLQGADDPRTMHKNFQKMLDDLTIPTLGFGAPTPAHH